ncbi:putative endonuclease [Modicisalibacter ilicicola DSM 19980]|uniref:Putative endonuclease n=1 Tax=Modicisalibacter ilicicola DSM 19980 TaxID=1121942 RepID=A0A1M4X3Y2_9GAMM|nr:GIY-YIG nuclease family protein [Halomonas ilicicola]SHE88186.1 putative endonuclease [Halomonas ilicicola DSM 19980]
MREPSAEVLAVEEEGGVAPCWHLYLIETAAGALYTGITTNVERRFDEHRSGKRGARALRGKGPLRLIHHQPVGSRSEALKLEAWLKKQSAPAKRDWLEGQR